MARYARPHVTSGLFHVVSRFQERRYFMDVKDARSRYLTMLSQALSHTDARLLAYCLMSSHIHLALQLGEKPLGRFTRTVNSGWAQWLNKELGRIGTVFAERPVSVLCEAELYVDQLVRYIHNNPVKAGVVSQAKESTWSSHRAYMGLEDAPPWLEIEPMLSRFALSVDDALSARTRLAFDEYVNGGSDDEIRFELSGRLSPELSQKIRILMRGPVEISYPVLGSDAFIQQAFSQQVKSHRVRSDFSGIELSASDVLLAVCLETGIDKSLILSRSRTRQAVRGRKLTVWVWCELFQQLQVEAAELFGVSKSAVSAMISRMRLESFAESNEQLLDKVVSLLESRERETGFNGGTDVQCAPSASTRSQVLFMRRNRESRVRLFVPKRF